MTNSPDRGPIPWVQGGLDIPGVRLMVKERAMRYLAGYPGLDTLAGNVSVHGLARRCVRDDNLTLKELSRLTACLDYREYAMKWVLDLIPIMGLLPFVEPCQWCPTVWQRDPNTQPFHDRLDRPIRRIMDAGLIPQPNHDQGRPWIKTTYYLCAAVQHTGLMEEELAESIERAKTWRDAQVERV
ncbi:MAG: hypothetical protein M1823_003950 [Watsoniomyces obsoletus]|nr:MAG: hypothetical protein M1823_003950 [Watsoniomyces obsoletus]